MKSKFLDLRNCKALLPPSFAMKEIRHFDEYLEELNNYPGHRGIVSKLIMHNQKTQNYKSWERLLSYDIDVCLTLNYQTKQIECRIQDNIAHPEFARTGFNKRVEAQLSNVYENGTRSTCRMPLQFLLKGWGDANEGYQGYVHSIKYPALGTDNEATNSSGIKSNEQSYVGITGRNWFQRFGEHMAETFKGSHKLFHRAWQGKLR